MADDSGAWSFEYNADGLRVYRSNGTTEYQYYYNGDKLTRMVVNGQKITFGYDANGTPQYVLYDGNRYFYLTNLQGDVTAIVSVNGNIVVEYTYDAWGNVLSIEGVRKDNLGKLNPLRYRGYVYDEETKLYYLQSRYYDPAICRFINADVYAATGQDFIGNNMFAYCGNNPVNAKDPQGTLAIGAFVGSVVGGAIAGAVISTVSYTVLSGLSGESITKEGVIDAALSGAASGALGGAIGTISVGAKVVSAAQKIIPSVTKETLTNGAKATASIATGILMSNNQTQQGIMMASVTTSTFLGSMIQATTNTFCGSAFCNYAATFFVGTAFEVGTVSARQFAGN